MSNKKNKTEVQETKIAQGGIRVATSCRVCAHDALAPVLSLGNHYVSDFVDTMTENASAPLELVICNASEGGCGLLQLKHTVDQASLYRNYWYRSGINKTMRDALQDIANKASELAQLQKDDYIIDTGSNDNTLLQSYARSDINRIGFEPATNLMPYAQHPEITVINDFFSAAPFKKKTNGATAKIVTSIAMFYDLEYPNEFVADITSCLHKDGIWIIQMAYLPSMLLDNIFDNICHEHLEYYSLLSLENLLHRHNLKVVDIELNDVNGGSYRTYITHNDNTTIKPFAGAADHLEALRTQEKTMHLNTLAPYHDFAESVESIKEHVTSFITQAIKKGKTVYVYGASTKGNTLLQYFGLDHTIITAAAERNPDKWGKKTVGTLIPIISEEDARAAKPDYFLILPWHFLKEFKEREQEYLQSGGKFIVPLPTFEIVESAD